MKEEDIRKRVIFNEYLALVEEDVKKLFSDRSKFVEVACPACSSSIHSYEFEKNGFAYVKCNACNTLFVNPRPSFKELMAFYSESASTSFWVQKFFKPVAEVRREQIFKPRAEYVGSLISNRNKCLVGDIGSGFGIFLDELKSIWPEADLVAIEPSIEQAEECRYRGLKVLELALEEVTGFDDSFDLLSCFEVFEHLYEPASFLEHVYKLLKPGGIFFMTTLNGQGFDIQVLWEKSKSFNPPLHLNFFNPASIIHLFEQSKFKEIRVSTPGKLDWDIVEGMITEESAKVERLWKYLADHGTSECKADLQTWINKYNLSSHMQVMAVK